MNVKTSTSNDGKTLAIGVSGDFQFALHREFRDAYLSFTQSGGEICVNLAATTYMDSSALGMLMLLLEHTKKHQQKAVIQAVPQAIRRILDIASFDKLFRIE